MELKDLKKTWDKLSDGKNLDENQIREMLGKKTKTLIERIDRNIKIGFAVLFILIFIFAFDDFFLSPLITKGLSENLEVPRWLLFFGVFSNALIFTTFLFFVIKYYRVKRSCDVMCNLRETLLKIIETLSIYRRLFYLALVTLLLAMASGFVTGMYQGFLDGVEQKGVTLSEIEPVNLILPVFIGIIILAFLVGGFFLLLRWGFKSLYGNYIDKLKLTLTELEEIEE
jgi:hypothetical protein